jgi:signal transduction histidine kinase
VSVKIKDSGTGIAPQKIERIFEPFFTLTKGGTGLGLTLVKHFIDSMGGEVRIHNNDPLPGCTAELILNTTRREDIECETEDSADR